MINHDIANATSAVDGGGNENGIRDGNDGDHATIDSKMIDLNMRPVRTPGQTSNTQVCHFFVVLNVVSFLFLFLFSFLWLPSNY